MTSDQTLDGRVVHANGAFEFKLRGPERAKAHAEIMKLTWISVRASNHKESSDLAIREIMRTDPSLFLEPIPNRCPLPKNESGTWVDADTVWSNYARWHGTWLARMVMPSAEYMRTVQASLELGIHPDDESVWPAKRLLCTEGWITTPKKLSLALSHGASPNRGTNWEEGYLCQVLTGIRSCLVDNLTKETEINIADRVRCAELLLKAGSTEIAYPMSKPQQLTAIGYLVNSGSSQALGYTHIHPIIFELMERLQHAGADIDRFGGVMMQPPLIHALRCLNIDGACQLIRMGCKTDDAHIVRTSGLGGIIKPLMVEAHEAGKEAFTTRILAAMMERQLLVSNAKEPTAAANESVSETPRRRMAV